MAYPIIEDITTTLFTGDDDNPLVVDLPATINSGDLLIMIVGLGEGRNHTVPSGWSRIMNQTTAQYSSMIFTRTADGSEGATVSVDLTSPSRATAFVVRISGQQGGVELETFESISNSRFPNPPEITASWGNVDNLVIAGFHRGIGSDFIIPITGPSGYSNFTALTTSDNTSTDANTAIATLQKTSDTEDPPTFSIANSTSWFTFTIVVEGTNSFIPSVTFKDESGNPIEGAVVQFFTIDAFDAKTPEITNLTEVGSEYVTDANGVATYDPNTDPAVDTAKVYGAIALDATEGDTEMEPIIGISIGRQNVDLTLPA